MNNTFRMSPRISRSLAVITAACASLLCAGCAQSAKPVAATTGAITRPTTTAPSAHPARLVADATVRRDLLAAFIAFRSNAANTPGYATIPRSAVAGIAPGTLRYGYDPATGTYWAVASFSATKAAAPTDAFVGFQDGGNDAVFRLLQGGSWRVKSVGPCRAGLPASVASALGLAPSSYPGCASGTSAS